MNRAAEETIASEDIQERTLISREAQATKDVTGERTGAFAAPVRSQLSAAQAVAGVFQVAESGRGVKQRRGLIFGVNFPECLEAQAKSWRHPGDMHGFLQLCLMVLAEAGTSKSPGGAGAGLQKYQRILASARARNPVATGKSGERTGRGNLSDILHR